MEGCSLTGLGSALPKQRTVVTPTERQLALWRQARGGAVMDPRYKIDILEKIYSGDPAAKPFLDQEIPVEVPTTLRCQTADMVLRRQQRELGLIGHALTTGLNDLEGASTHFLSAVEEIGEGPVRERLLQAHREMTQASTHPLGHALRMLRSRFNDAANKRRRNLALSISDKMLAQQIRAAPLGYDSLLASSLQPAIQASTSRQQNNLLIAALRNNSLPATRRRSRSPVRRYQSQDGQQQQQTRQQQQPFRRGSRGGRGFSRGSRGTRGTRGADLPSLEGRDSLGHLTERRDWWDSVARDSFVCEAVRGHRLEFESRPPVKKMKKIKIKIKNSEKKKVLQKEVDALLTKGAIEVVRAFIQISFC